MGKDSGSDTQKTTTSNEPWGPQGVRYQEALRRAAQLFKNGRLRIKPFPGSSVAPQSGATRQALSGIQQRAADGSPLNKLSADYVSRTLDPGYLTSDSPGLSSVLDSAANDTAARFAMAGRTFSGAHAGALGNSQGQIRYQDYARKAAEQAQAAQFAPQLAREDFFELNQMRDAGRQRDAYQQDRLNSRINRFNAIQQAPINELALYQDLIGGNLGGTTTATQPVDNGNPWLSALGGLGTIGASIPWYML